MENAKIAILADLNSRYEPHYVMDSCFKQLQETSPFTHEWIPTGSLDKNFEAVLKRYDGIIAGSGPYKSKTGIINGIRYARLNNIPFLGTCSGFGYAVLEFGQHLFKLPDVYHPYERTDLRSGEIFLHPLNNCSTVMTPVTFSPVTGTLAAKIYGTGQVTELSHCTYGVNPLMIQKFAEEGFIVSGIDNGGEAKLMEYKPNSFFVITLFLPQLRSTVVEPHPLIRQFLQSVLTKPAIDLF